MRFSHVTTSLSLAAYPITTLGIPHHLKRENVLSLDEALKKTANVSCDDPNFKEPDHSTPDFRWQKSGAGDLLPAIVHHWGQYGENKKYPSMSTYAASLAGLGTTNFRCEDLSVTNDCSKYTPKCDTKIGPAMDIILTSMSNMHNYYKGIVDQLAEAKVETIGSAFDAAKAVEYKKPDNGLGMLADILGLALMPVGGGALVSSMVRRGTEAAAERAAKLPGSIGDFWKKAQPHINEQGAALGEEMGAMTEEALTKGKQPTEGAMDFMREVASFTQLGINVLNSWSNGTSNATRNMFMGKMKGDEDVGNGVSNMASLLHSLDGGLWLDGMGSADAVKETAASQYLAYALPLAELMNDAVRPTIVMRPYKCDDQKRAGDDKKFKGWLGNFASKVSVTLDDVPGICFYVVDANQKGSTEKCSSGKDEKCSITYSFKELKSINHDELDHDAGKKGKWGSISLEDYVQSSYFGWKNNGKKNGVPDIDLTTQKPDGKNNIWDSPMNAPGEWNRYFTVCGTDDPNYKFDKNTPPDIDLIEKNFWQAHLHWDWADRKKRPYPCANDVPA